MQNPFAAAYAFYLGIPAPIREPVKSAFVSFSLTAQALLFALYAGYGVLCVQTHVAQTLGGFLVFCASAWFAVFGAMLNAAYRARQGFRSATQTVVTTASTSIPNPQPPQKIVAVEVAAPGEPTTVVPTPAPVKGP
jgi:hypothetical protein